MLLAITTSDPMWMISNILLPDARLKAAVLPGEGRISALLTSARDPP